MKISEQGLKLIKCYEGLKLKAYRCPAGKKTIGYGHVILPTEGLTHITQEKADELFLGDVKWAEDCVNKSVKTPLSQNEFDALVSFVFNLGSGAFVGSTLLKYLNLSRLTEAGAQFDRWTRAKGKVLPGLVKRRASERKLFVTGVLTLT
jgi:lysozyme